MGRIQGQTGQFKNLEKTLGKSIKTLLAVHGVYLTLAVIAQKSLKIFEKTIKITLGEPWGESRASQDLR